MLCGCYGCVVRLTMAHKTDKQYNGTSPSRTRTEEWDVFNVSSETNDYLHTRIGLIVEQVPGFYLHPSKNKNINIKRKSLWRNVTNAVFPLLVHCSNTFVLRKRLGRPHCLRSMGTKRFSSRGKEGRRKEFT